MVGVAESSDEPTVVLPDVGELVTPDSSKKLSGAGSRMTLM
jgi:hypothetical protein